MDAVLPVDGLEEQLVKYSANTCLGAGTSTRTEADYANSKPFEYVIYALVTPMQPGLAASLISRRPVPLLSPCPPPAQQSAWPSPSFGRPAASTVSVVRS